MRYDTTAAIAAINKENDDDDDDDEFLEEGTSVGMCTIRPVGILQLTLPASDLRVL